MSSEESHLGLLDSVVCSAEILCESELFVCGTEGRSMTCVFLYKI